MQLVLVAGMNPRVQSAIGPRVQLFAGKWRIITEGVKDSTFFLCDSKSDVEVKHGSVIESSGGVFNIMFKSRGTEPFINIFAEYINGLDAPKPA